MRVQVYRNLNKGGLSIRTKCADGKWRVTDHAPQVVLSDCTYKVREGGRQRVLRDKQKNVHAWIEGELISKSRAAYDKSTAPEPYYSPYNQDHFSIDGKPVAASKSARVYCAPK